MRAIIIDDAACRALLDKLELANLEAQKDPRRMMPFKTEDAHWTIAEVHRYFHYEVCRWLQAQGANTTR